MTTSRTPAPGAKEETPPEGATVEIAFDGTHLIPADLQEELDAWAAGSAGAVELVERLADEGS